MPLKKLAKKGIKKSIQKGKKVKSSLKEKGNSLKLKLENPNNIKTNIPNPLTKNYKTGNAKPDWDRCSPTKSPEKPVKPRTRTPSPPKVTNTGTYYPVSENSYEPKSTISDLATDMRSLTLTPKKPEKTSDQIKPTQTTSTPVKKKVPKKVENLSIDDREIEYRPRPVPTIAQCGRVFKNP